jgi:hypothetical protein
MPNFKVARNKKDPGISEEICNKIIKAIELGSYVETAAAFAGISKQTFYNWLKKGARSKTGLEATLVDAVQKAMASSELRDLSRIEKAAESGIWQAAAWRLERKFPNRWGRKERIEHSGPDGAPIQLSRRQEQVIQILRNDESAAALKLIANSIVSQCDEVTDE